MRKFNKELTYEEFEEIAKNLGCSDTSLMEEDYDSLMSSTEIKSDGEFTCVMCTIEGVDLFTNYGYKIDELALPEEDCSEEVVDTNDIPEVGYCKYYFDKNWSYEEFLDKMNMYEDTNSRLDYDSLMEANYVDSNLTKTIVDSHLALQYAYPSLLTGPCIPKVEYVGEYIILSDRSEEEVVDMLVETKDDMLKAASKKKESEPEVESKYHIPVYSMKDKCTVTLDVYDVANALGDRIKTEQAKHSFKKIWRAGTGSKSLLEDYKEAHAQLGMAIEYLEAMGEE